MNEHRPATSTRRNLTKAQRQKIAELVSWGTESYHVTRDGKRTLLRGGVLQPRRSRQGRVGPFVAPPRVTTSTHRERRPTLTVAAAKARAKALRKAYKR